jgi:PhnB protein
MSIQPYLFFEGRCEEAAEFYRAAVGAEVLMMMRNRESPEAPPPGKLPPGAEDKILHMSLRIGDSTLMCSDGFASGRPDFKGFALTYSTRDAAEADRVFARLADGGQVHMPLTSTFFSPRFGMLADRFGVAWMIMADPAATS